MATGVVQQLDQIQRWMQAVIMHPDGVIAGIDSQAARGQLDVEADRVEDVITRSRNLTSVERLQIYSNAYVARLVECLREEFPALLHALGQEAFDGFALAYLQAHPSTSYTLANLGSRFPQFLHDTCPDDLRNDDDSAGAEADWAAFLIDLVPTERTYSEVFDGPGAERERLLQPEDLAAIPPPQWPEVRFTLNPSLRLLTLSYPIHEYISAVRHQQEAVIPHRSPTYLVVFRREFVVRRVAVSPVESAILAALQSGESLGKALEQAAGVSGSPVELSAENLQEWFRTWTASTFFRKVSCPA